MRSSEKAIEVEGRLSQEELAQSVPVYVTLEADGLSVKRQDRSQLAFWSFSNLRPASRIRASDNDVFLHNTQSPRATLLLKGNDVAKDLLTRAPQIVLGRRRRNIAALAITAAFAFAAFIFFGTTRYPRTIAQLVPHRVLYKLGQQSTGMFLRLGTACQKQAGVAALQKIMTRLEGGGNYGRPFELHVAHSPLANAFALPGRQIVLLSGVINESKNAEELAGVIAHELGHGLELDPDSLFIKSVGLDALAEYFIPESGNDSALAFNSVLLQLRYSVKAERAADKHALEILRNAEVSPRPMGQFLLRHTIGLRPPGGSLQYVSTHPSPEARTRLYSAPEDYASHAILSSEEWAEAKAVCDSDTANAGR